MIRRTRAGDIVTNRLLHSTAAWVHFPIGTPMERITLVGSPAISEDERQRVRLIRLQGDDIAMSL